MIASQPNYAESADEFAKLPPLQVTLRIMQAIYANPRFWVGMSVLIMVLTIMGPFNTLNEMAFAPRLVYWGGLSLVTFPVGMAISIFASIWLQRRSIPAALSRLLGGAIGGIPLGGIVYVANTWFAGSNTGTLPDLAQLTAYTVPISAAISVIYYLVETGVRPHAQTVSENTGPQATPAFIDRLPKPLGKDIISLQAQDHYVRITTTKGSEMILLRLSDAERELEGMKGMRVHRSWWVARNHIDELKRENEKWLAVLSNGESVPVSRTQAAKVREWFNKKDT